MFVKLWGNCKFIGINDDMFIIIEIFAIIHMLETMLSIFHLS